MQGGIPLSVALMIPDRLVLKGPLRRAYGAPLTVPSRFEGDGCLRGEKGGELSLPGVWFLSEGHQPRAVCNSSFPPSHFLPFNSLDSSWSVMLLMSPMFMIRGWGFSPDEPLFIANLNSR